MPPDPLEDFGPMVKIENTSQSYSETPDLYKPLLRTLQILKYSFCGTFSSYMLFLVIIERKIEI